MFSLDDPERFFDLCVNKLMESHGGRHEVSMVCEIGRYRIRQSSEDRRPWGPIKRIVTLRSLDEQVIFQLTMTKGREKRYRWNKFPSDDINMAVYLTVV